MSFDLQTYAVRSLLTTRYLQITKLSGRPIALQSLFRILYYCTLPTLLTIFKNVIVNSWNFFISFGSRCSWISSKTLVHCHAAMLESCRDASWILLHIFKNLCPSDLLKLMCVLLMVNCWIISGSASSSVNNYKDLAALCPSSYFRSFYWLS